MHFKSFSIYIKIVQVYRKLTHAKLYLNAVLYHHPANKHPVLSNLVYQARAICNQEVSQKNWNSFIEC